jgi:hypothetical protein
MTLIYGNIIYKNKYIEMLKFINIYNILILNKINILILNKKYNKL